jgi:hypothetical protein
MLRQGPIPAFVHGVIEYLAAAVFIVAPFVLNFDSGTAKAVSIVVGLVILVVTASSDLPTGLAKAIPVPIHATLDFIIGIVLVAAPFLFRFTSDGKATAFFIALGVFHILVTIATRFLPPRAAAAEAGGNPR